jgi:mannose-1-phosphate guanylyltransferase/mannose-6-phosphate isomerase
LVACRRDDARVIHAVILSGGSGTRLWPASRRARPKQLLPLAGPETLLEAAVRRGQDVAATVAVVTAATQVDATRALVGDATVIAEPVGRNTAAAIGLAAATLIERDPDAIMVVLPADQHVRDGAALSRALLRLIEVVRRDDSIGTVGIKAVRAETGFGYLEIGAPSEDVVPVVRFVEKPDKPTAERYVASGRFAWNAGMFVMSARRALAELDANVPATGKAVRAIAGGADAAALYPTLPSISIDHAVMETAANVVTITVDAGWDDVGSWAAIPAVRGVDATGNTTAGPAIVLGGTGNIVMSDDATLIATVGVSNVVVVKAGDAILVIDKDRAQDVREVVDALIARGLARYL